MNLREEMQQTQNLILSGDTSKVDEETVKKATSFVKNFLAPKFKSLQYENMFVKHFQITVIKELWEKASWSFDLDKLEHVMYNEIPEEFQGSDLMFFIALQNAEEHGIKAYRASEYADTGVQFYKFEVELQ